MKDSKKEIPDKIKYLKIMNSLYSLNTKKTIIIDYKDLKNEYDKIKYLPLINVCEKVKKTQLFELDKKIIKLCSFYIKSRDLFISLKIKEKEEIKINYIEKKSITRTLQNHFSFIVKGDYFIIGASIYIFSIIFPLFPSHKIILFLKEILENLKKMFFFKNIIYILFLPLCINII